MAVTCPIQASCSPQGLGAAPETVRVTVELELRVLCAQAVLDVP